jgi:hypothetical protein
MKITGMPTQWESRSFGQNRFLVIWVVIEDGYVVRARLCVRGSVIAEAAWESDGSSAGRALV